MKRTVLGLTMLLCTVFDSHAFKIGGFNFSWQRGRPEWNADKTDTRCVGKGMCTGKIGFDVDIKPTLHVTPDGLEGFDTENNQYTGNLIHYKNGLAIEFSRQYYDSYRQDFDGGYFQLNQDLIINYNVLQLLGYQGGNSFRAGNYPFTKDPQTGALLVILE